MKGEEETIIDAFLKTLADGIYLENIPFIYLFILLFFFNLLKGILFLQREKVNSF